MSLSEDLKGNLLGNVIKNYNAQHAYKKFRSFALFFALKKVIWFTHTTLINRSAVGVTQATRSTTPAKREFLLIFCLKIKYRLFHPWLQLKHTVTILFCTYIKNKRPKMNFKTISFSNLCCLHSSNETSHCLLLVT